MTDEKRNDAATSIRSAIRLARKREGARTITPSVAILSAMLGRAESRGLPAFVDVGDAEDAFVLATFVMDTASEARRTLDEGGSRKAAEPVQTDAERRTEKPPMSRAIRTPLSIILWIIAITLALPFVLLLIWAMAS